MMQRLTLTFPGTGYAETDRFDLFWNIDAAGRADGEVAFDEPANGVRLEADHWSQEPPGHLEAPCLEAPHLSDEGRLGIETEPVYFGAAKAAIVAYDEAGNAAGGEIEEVEVVVNSCPEAPRKFIEKAWDAENGIVTFEFEQPGQLR